ncbi:hypothetical protein IAQ61_003942 [Plenodomus lingam]|uniref:Uncharacterized protein n=1 Tax=Leptosphaeria maculans (strain JN3 / isolate v23.1.3 / race Av1-4-5-6-7-8) TaxID=985895 RepID=E4ZQR4_LEPMJ|nr:hypothetical protein LEMA_P037430.1 [Plenodomus lingam JN3]KAH9874752.1 hypothetical protein IAQ61_003942 [Plenodomus lingam]CBX94069.1 hypothetical protein LEMA_P037430.1 [Plenodomus lingam JN3]
MQRRTYFGPPEMEPAEATVKNLADCGFERLRLPTLRHNIHEPPLPPDFKPLTSNEQTKYLNMIYQKLMMACTYFKMERDLGLNYDRAGMHKDATSVTLSEGPIRLDLHTQAHLKLLMDEEKDLRDLVIAGYGEDSGEVIEAARQYLSIWKNIQQMLVWQVPRETEKIRRICIQNVMKVALWDIIDDLESK